MPNFWKVLNSVIKDADIILEILDAREIDKTRNIEIEDKVQKAGKRLIYVFNKCDLVDIEELKKRKKDLQPSLFISAKDVEGTKMLREKILACSGSKKQVYVGVVGYPNTGKSSLINALAGRAKASTSAESGHTKGRQLIRISQRIKLIDTPGVVPYKEKDNEKHGTTGTIDYAKIKHPEEVVQKIIEDHPGKLEEFYEVEAHDDPEETLSEIAIKYNHLKKGGVPDHDKASRMILRAWQRGNIKHD